MGHPILCSLGWGGGDHIGSQLAFSSSPGCPGGREVPAHLAQVPLNRCSTALEHTGGAWTRFTTPIPVTPSARCFRAGHSHMCQPRLKACGRSCPPESESQPEVLLLCLAERLQGGCRPSWETEVPGWLCRCAARAAVQALCSDCPCLFNALPLSGN